MNGGLAKFDGINWTNTSNSGLPANSVWSLAIDGSGNKWIGTSDGLAKFDNTNWTVYNTSNSGLPANFVSFIVIDGSGNKWIGTGGGLAVYNEGGVVSIEENPTLREIIPLEYLLFQNYPNPFNPSTTIKYEIPKQALPAGRHVRDDNVNVTLKVYDILGREVATLVNQQQKAGYYEVSWNAVNNSSGVYFYKLTAGAFVETKKLVLLK